MNKFFSTDINIYEDNNKLKELLIKSFNLILKRIYKNILKSKEMPVGSRSQRNDGVYIKQPDGKWVKETETKEEKKWKKMVGSEKQIAWAKEIKTNFIDDARRKYEHYMRIKTDNKLTEVAYTEDDLKNYEHHLNEIKRVVNLLKTKNQASWWIENREKLSKLDFENIK